MILLKVAYEEELKFGSILLTVSEPYIRIPFPAGYKENAYVWNVKLKQVERILSHVLVQIPAPTEAAFSWGSDLNSVSFCK